VTLQAQASVNITITTTISSGSSSKKFFQKDVKRIDLLRRAAS
jgi:hypothetical protein